MNQLQGTLPASMGSLSRMQMCVSCWILYPGGWGFMAYACALPCALFRSYIAGSGLCGKLPGALVQADLPALPPNCSCAFNSPLESTCAALGDMYASMGGPGWSMQAGWASAAAGVPSDYCSSFAGVRCAT